MQTLYPFREGKKEDQRCISRQDRVWKNELCFTVVSGEVPGSVTCQCKSLSPTTVVNDINGLFSDSKIDEVFSDDGLGNLLRMKFWEFPIFYVLLLKTLLFVLLLLKGKQLDREDSLRVFPLQDVIIERDQSPTQRSPSNNSRSNSQGNRTVKGLMLSSKPDEVDEVKEMEEIN